MTTGVQQAAAGHRSVTLQFRLAPGAAPCTLTGYPGVDSGAGGPLLHATRTLSGYMGGLRTDTLPTVTLEANRPQFAIVEGVAVDPNNPDGSCPTYTDLLVTPPGTTETSTIPVEIDTCELQVHPVGAPSADQPASVAPDCAGLGGTVDANRNCHIVTESETYSIDITYPLDYPDQGALTTFIKQDRDEFIDFVTQMPRHDRTYDYGVNPHSYQSGQSGTAEAGTRSVVLELYGDTGAHPVTGFHALNYDLAAHAPITFDTFFRAGAVEVLDPIVQREMDKHWQGYEGPAPGNTLGSKVYENFAITDDAVIFYIGQGMWLPEVAGPQRVSVPRAELASILTQT